MTARLSRTLPLLLLALSLGGCVSIDPRLSDLVGPAYTPANTRGPATLARNDLTHRRPPRAHDTTGRLPTSFVSTYDSLWRRALDRTQRAEWISLSHSQLATWTTRESLTATGLLPPDLLARIGRETDAQAVLFLDINHANPYPPLAISFRARLVVIATGETLWMADELFDAGHAPTARGARRYARANTSGPGDPTAAILQSPSLFADYAFQAVSALLPPRVNPPATSK